MLYRRALVVVLAGCFSALAPEVSLADDRGVKVSDIRVNGGKWNRGARAHAYKQKRANCKAIRHKAKRRRTPINKGSKVKGVPELDRGGAGAALGLLLGASLVVAERRRRSVRI